MDNRHANSVASVPPVDLWDSFGKRHDLALANSRGPLDSLAADLTYSLSAGTHGWLVSDPLEIISAAVVPLRPFVA